MILFVPHIPGVGSYAVIGPYDGATLYRGTYSECRRWKKAHN